MRMRLDRWLTTLGVCSRSEAKELIRKGAVRVNGAPARDAGAAVETERDALSVRGQDVDGRTTRHVMLHKPAGLLTAARDRKQPTVMDLLPPGFANMGCMPVGRLDRDTTGLLLLTCDGEMNHRLLAPGRHVGKEYEARVTGRLSERDVRAFAGGMELSDFTAMPAELRILEAGEETSLARVVIAEGKYHQVKRMFSAAGHEVLTLHRVRFGPLELDPSLPEGAWRELTGEELSALRRAAGMPEGEGRPGGDAPDSREGNRGSEGMEG